MIHGDSRWEEWLRCYSEQINATRFTIYCYLSFVISSEMSGDYVNSHYVHTDKLILDKILTVSGERFSVQFIHFTFVFQVFQLKINFLMSVQNVFRKDSKT